MDGEQFIQAVRLRLRVPEALKDMKVEMVSAEILEKAAANSKLNIVLGEKGPAERVVNVLQSKSNL